MKPSSYGVGAPNAAIKAVAGRKAKPAAKKPGAGTAPPVNVQPAVERYTGAFSAPLNELSTAEQRVRDVAARRQADALQYNAFVLGQQGKLAAAAQQQDQSAFKNTVGVQLAAAGANLGAQKRLQEANAAQGITGPTPPQQLGGLVDDQQRSNLLMAATSQRAADSANTNAGKAGFLAAAAQAGLAANQRAIAGDEYTQTSDIRREKVGLMAQKDAAEASAAQAVADRNARAYENAADRSSRENIAAANITLRQQLNESDQAFQARQKRADRKVRLQTSATGAAALGYVAPAELKRRDSTVRKIEQNRDKAIGMLADNRQFAAKAKQPYTVADARYDLEQDMKGAPAEVIDYALARAFGAKAGTKKGKSTAARRYYDYIARIKRGEISE